MRTPKETDPQVILQRLTRALEGAEVPDEEEARQFCARMGIDVDAVHARILEQVDAFEAKAAQKRRFRVVPGGGAGRRDAAEPTPDVIPVRRRKAGSDPGR